MRRIETLQELIELKEKGELVGVFEMSNELYHAGPGISKSKLDDLNRSPLRMKHFGDKKVTPEMAFGSAADMFICDRNAFEEIYAVPQTHIEGPLNRNPGKKLWDEFKAANPGKIHLKPADFKKIEGVSDAIKSHPTASKLVDGPSQLSFYWIDPIHGVLSKCRPDFISTSLSICTDLKTTDNASYYTFRSKAYSMRYYVQQSFYLDGIKHAVEQARLDFPIPDSFVFAVVERDQPHDIAVYQLDDASLELGRLHYQDNMVTYKKCLDTDIWPGYDTSIQPMHLPPWAYKEGEDV